MTGFRTPPSARSPVAGVTILTVRALCTVFFVSGAAALIFETLWFRQAGFAFGSSAWASVLVLSSFMAGLALGNLLTAAFGTRIRRPVAFYALLEVLVGVWGLVLIVLLAATADWLAPLMRPFIEHPEIVNPLRFAIAFLMLLVPATAMGATLPVLVMVLRLRDPSFGSVLGRLYGFNALGGMVGAVAGEMLLIEQFGVLGTGVFAAGLSFAAAAVALALSLGAGRGSTSAAPKPGPAPIPARGWALAAAAFLSGGILLALEVVWFRILLLFTHPSSLAFALMLAVVLAGIGGGGLVAGSWLKRDPHAFRYATLMAFLSGAVCIASYIAFPRVVAAYSGTVYIVAPKDILWLSVCLMLATSLCSGLLFTLTGTALNQRVAPDIQAAGLVTFSNTLGSALGPIAAGFLLLPWLGIEGSFFLLSALYAVTAIILLAARDRPGFVGFGLAGVVGAAVFAAALVLAMSSEERDYYQVVARSHGAPEYAEIADVRETPTGTVMYLNTTAPGESTFQRLVTGAFGMASNQINGRRYMKLFVYWPVALRPNPKTALLIGFGVGNSAKALTDTRSFERIDIADISPDVIEMGKLAFPDPDAYPMSDPRVKLYIEDGRYLLETTDARYDLITSEPPPPKFAGIDSLYSKEYFELVREHLTEGGINTHWLPVRFLTVGDTKAIIRGYCEAFPDCSVWAADGFQWMLVGSRNAEWKRSRPGFEAQWQDTRVGPELRALGMELPAQIGAMFVADADQLRELVGDTPPLEDNFPRRLVQSFAGSEDRETYAQWTDTDAVRRRFRDSAFIREAWPESIREETFRYFDYQRVLTDFVNANGGLPPERVIRELDMILESSALRTLPLWLLGIRENPGEPPEGSGAGDQDFYSAWRSGGDALADRDFEKAARIFASAQRRWPGNADLLLMRLFALCQRGDSEEASELLREAQQQALRPELAAAFVFLERKCSTPASSVIKRSEY